MGIINHRLVQLLISELPRYLGGAEELPNEAREALIASLTGQEIKDPGMTPLSGEPVKLFEVEKRNIEYLLTLVALVDNFGAFREGRDNFTAFADAFYDQLGRPDNRQDRLETQRMLALLTLSHSPYSLLAKLDETPLGDHSTIIRSKPVIAVPGLPADATQHIHNWQNSLYCQERKGPGSQH
ncbi:MAG: hypothetical protein ABIH34_01875 [Nanoarchaeota archaeon]